MRIPRRRGRDRVEPLEAIAATARGGAAVRDDGRGRTHRGTSAAGSSLRITPLPTPFRIVPPDRRGEVHEERLVGLDGRVADHGDGDALFETSPGANVTVPAAGLKSVPGVAGAGGARRVGHGDRGRARVRERDQEVGRRRAGRAALQHLLVADRDLRDGVVVQDRAHAPACRARVALPTVGAVRAMSTRNVSSPSRFTSPFTETIDRLRGLSGSEGDGAAGGDVVVVRGGRGDVRRRPLDGHGLRRRDGEGQVERERRRAGIALEGRRVRDGEDRRGVQHAPPGAPAVVDLARPRPRPPRTPGCVHIFLSSVGSTTVAL